MEMRMKMKKENVAKILSLKKLPKFKNVVHEFYFKLLI